VWNNAGEYVPSFLQPEKNGWNLIDKKYEICWFDGPLVPDNFSYPEGEIPEELSLSDSDEEFCF
jgi:hypothetical protein